MLLLLFSSSSVTILYVVHPGSVTLLDGTTEFVDAGTLAARYGLSPGEYYVGIDESTDKGNHIHLYPRTDGRYRSIKTEVGDVPEGELFYAKSAQAMRRDRLRGME